VTVRVLCAYHKTVDEICGLPWQGLSADELVEVAWAYWHFSIQFRENLKIARDLYPEDRKLRQLETEECDTANLSPWPGIAGLGERMNHDEFVRRLLLLTQLDEARQARLEAIGQSYLAQIRAIDPWARASSIASYEDGGLNKVFRAFLRARSWDGPALLAFRHFMTRHIGFDSEPEAGHGALSRHRDPDDRILPLWTAFKTLLVKSVPRLENC